MQTTIILLLCLKGIRLLHDYKDWYRKMERIKPLRIEQPPLPEYVLMVRAAARVKNNFSIKLNLE